MKNPEAHYITAGARYELSGLGFGAERWFN